VSCDGFFQRDTKNLEVFWSWTALTKGAAGFQVMGLHAVGLLFFLIRRLEFPTNIYCRCADMAEASSLWKIRHMGQAGSLPTLSQSSIG
jgi:hypothetical protein